MHASSEPTRGRRARNGLRLGPGSSHDVVDRRRERGHDLVDEPAHALPCDQTTHGQQDDVVRPELEPGVQRRTGRASLVDGHTRRVDGRAHDHEARVRNSEPRATAAVARLIASTREARGRPRRRARRYDARRPREVEPVDEGHTRHPEQDEERPQREVGRSVVADDDVDAAHARRARPCGPTPSPGTTAARGSSRRGPRGARPRCPAPARSRPRQRASPYHRPTAGTVA